MSESEKKKTKTKQRTRPFSSQVNKKNLQTVKATKTVITNLVSAGGGASFLLADRKTWNPAEEQQ